METTLLSECIASATESSLEVLDLYLQLIEFAVEKESHTQVTPKWLSLSNHQNKYPFLKFK